MVDVNYETKKLTSEVLDNEAKYISGQLDLTPSLERTDQLFKIALAGKDPTANKILQDSGLLHLQSRIVRQCAKCYKPDTLTFDAIEFSGRLLQYFDLPSGSDEGHVDASTLWHKMGKAAQSRMCSAPTFNYIYGSFSADPVELTKKKRRMKEKDKLGDLTKPESVSLNAITADQDMIVKEAERVLSILLKLSKRSSKGVLCYYECVTDPASFTRTVENIFVVSLLVKEGVVIIFEDENGLPCLQCFPQKQERNPSAVSQSVVSISMDDWENIVKTFKFTKALIPRSKSLHSQQ